MTFGSRIRNRREELGMTQTELAEKTMLRQGYISRVENDKFVPTAPAIIVLAKALVVIRNIRKNRPALNPRTVFLAPAPDAVNSSV